jgi:3',5'-cyclic AMP phosphodiesterase CpdA
MLRRAVFGLTFVALVMACSSSSDATSPPAATKPPRPDPTPLAPLTDAPTTVDRVLGVVTARQTYKDGPNPSSYDAMLDYEKRGFGDLVVQPGQPYVTRVIDGSTPPAPGPNAARILRFATLADLQLADDESPTRLAQYDSADITSAAARPEDAYLCRMTNAAVRTINALHAKDPIAFTLLGGDNADSAQTNELEWALGILSGAAQVKCDSGEDDDLVPGPDNDGKDPFVAMGLAMPWKWVTGNHDVLVQGNVKIDDGNRAAVVADTANGGTRNYAEGGAIETGDFVIPDPKRALLSRTDLMTKVAGDKDGHGLGDAEKASGRATYTFDVPGTSFRFLVIDSAHEMGGSEGVIRQSEVDRVIKPALDKAQADGKWVVLASHHSATSLTLDGGAFGFKETDALSTDQWLAFVGQYPNVLFSMVGHSHENRVRPMTPSTGHAWWEVMTAAIADFPHQFRVVEIYDQDNGWIMMRTAAVDFSVEGDPVAEEGRRRGVIDLTSGWMPNDGTGTANDRNVELWIKKP